jgi:hypothetical protein
MQEECGQKPNAGRFAGGHGSHFLGCKGEKKGFRNKQVASRPYFCNYRNMAKPIHFLSPVAAIASPVWVRNRACRLCVCRFPRHGNGGWRNSRRIGDSRINSFAPLGQTATRRPVGCAPRGNFLWYKANTGALQEDSRFSLRRVLHAQSCTASGSRGPDFAMIRCQQTRNGHGRRQPLGER